MTTLLPAGKRRTTVGSVGTAETAAEAEAVEAVEAAGAPEAAGVSGVTSTGAASAASAPRDETKPHTLHFGSLDGRNGGLVVLAKDLLVILPEVRAVCLRWVRGGDHTSDEHFKTHHAMHPLQRLLA